MSETRLNVPLPLQIVIDDVGWWSGRNGTADREPYRTGIDRDHVPADYEAVARLGRKLNMRPQAAMILCEWDVDDSLRALPSAQWMGEQWHNVWPREVMDEAADILRREKAHIELTLHGIGHEYWPGDGTVRRAEWFDRETKTHRPRDHVKGVLEAYARLLDVHDLGPMPQSFVPCAGEYEYDSHLAEMLRDAGVVYTSNHFSVMTNSDAAQDAMFGIESGLITLDRGNLAPPWPAIGVDPHAMEGYNADHCIVGLHWPNHLHADPARNDEVVDQWVNFLEPYGRKVDRMLSRDTGDCWSQLIYQRTADVTREGASAWTLDFSEADALGAAALRDELTVKWEAPAGESLTVRGGSVIESTYDDAAACHVVRLRRDGAVVRLDGES